MFLQSGPEMVIASCRAGIVGCFPSVNARTVADLEEWLERRLDDGRGRELLR